MPFRIPAFVAALLLMGWFTPAASATEAPAVKARHGVTLKASPKEVEEGDRIKLSARIKSPRKATRVSLEKLETSVLGDSEWAEVKAIKVKGRAKVTFRQVANSENSERYRAIVSYSDGKIAKSKPATVTVWRWIPLDDFSMYYETSFGYFGSVAINGLNYNGYYVYNTVNSWEAKFTAGRHCREMRAILGLRDDSDDESSGSVVFTAEDEVVYESPLLTPGMDVKVSMPIGKPYRLGFQLFDTSSEGLDAWPALGQPELLCTGV